MTLIERLRTLADTRGDALAYSFLLEGEVDGPRDEFTYAALDVRARTIGARLHMAQGRGERALLLYPPGLEFIAAFLGCLYGGVIAVPAYPPDPSRLERTLPRLRAIVRDADARFVLTTGPIAAMAEALFAEAPELASLTWVATDTLDTALAERWQHPRVSDETTAFLQYTSGSTGTPRGVVVSHRNIVHNAEILRPHFAGAPVPQGVVWLPMYHDMGLIGGVIVPLHAGFPVALMSPLDFLQKPLRWLQAITRYRGTTTSAPNFAYDLCVRRVTEAERATLDLSSWETAGCGAEPVRPETMERFYEAFAPCGFRRAALYPCYGLAEATLFVSGGEVATPPIVTQVSADALAQGRVAPAAAGDPDARSVVSCGQGKLDQVIRIVDPTRCVPSAPDAIGEIWLQGASVAQGYWNRPDETRATFHARLADTGEGPFLRTGDLGFVRDGELYVTGRIKDLLIIRGRNYYPTDIETTVERAHAAVRPGCVAALSVRIDGEEQLAIVAEVAARRGPLDPDAVMTAIRDAVFADHELRARRIALLPAGAIPKTSSGKLQRRETHARLVAGTLDALADARESLPTTTTTTTTPTTKSGAEPSALCGKLVDLTARALAVPARDVDPDAPLRALALESLTVADLLAELSNALGREVGFAEFREAATLRDLANRLESTAPAATPRAPHQIASRPEDPTAVSYTQDALIEECASLPGAWVHTRGFRLDGPVDEVAMGSALRRLALERDIFRTTFGPGPVSNTREPDLLTLSLEDATALDEAALAALFADEALRPFRLAAEPPLRARLLRRGTDAAILLLSIHHVAYDAVTLPRVFHRLFSLYVQYAVGLPPLDMPVVAPWRTLAWRERAWVNSEEGHRDLAWWREALQGASLYTGLTEALARRGPADHTLTPLAPLVLDATSVDGLRALGKQRGVTMPALVAAAYAAALGAATGTSDIVLSLSASLRDAPELRELDGPVLNFLFVRVRVTDDPLRTVDAARDSVEGAFAHRRYPSVELARRLAPTPAGCFQPRWSAQAVLNYYSLRRADEANARLRQPLRLGALTVAEIPLANLPVAKPFDLGLYVTEREGSMALELRHAEAFLESTRAQQLLGDVRAFLVGLAAVQRAGTVLTN